MFIIPSNCKEKITIITPAITLSIVEFCNNNFPKKDAVTPNKININEKPRQNNIIPM